MIKYLAAAIYTIGLFVCVYLHEKPKLDRYFNNKFSLYFLNVGQGDSAMLKTPGREIIVIDGGPSRDSVSRIGNILPFWVRKIDLVIVSHSHVDHITGVIELLREYDVKCLLYFEDDPSNTENETVLRDLIESHEIKLVDLSSGSKCINSDINLQSYKQNLKITYPDQNLESIVNLFQYGSFKAVFTGDADIDFQEKLLGIMPANIDVLKVPHQGSKYSMDKKFVSKLSPKLGVIPVGKNTYGHPHKEVLAYYDTQGIQLLKTDQYQYIEVNSDGLGFEVFVEEL